MQFRRHPGLVLGFLPEPPRSEFALSGVNAAIDARIGAGIGPGIDPDIAPGIGHSPDADGDDRVAVALRQPGHSWRDHLVMLLGIAAEVEHGLMVQYLYAAYSLGGPQVRGAKRLATVRRWRSQLLEVAIEEMGHLVTVQNILTLLGAPVALGREDYPWDLPYYPFPFVLEPLTRSSLACYIHAEMPPHVMDMLDRYPSLPKRLARFRDHDRSVIEGLVHQRVDHGLPAVGVIYDEIVALIACEDRIPDACFDETSYAAQASWDDWGRGHGPKRKTLDPGGTVITAPAHQRQANVLVLRAATRTDAVKALLAISGQGEAPHLDPTDGAEASHFERFLHIFQDFPADGDWEPARRLAINPTTRPDAGDPPVRGNVSTYGSRQTSIVATPTREWAMLSNVRYRLLLTTLAHSFRLARGGRRGVPDLRGMTMHRVFGEMYNLKTIAGLLADMPVYPGAAPGPETEVAGPPFEVPFSLELPDGDIDAWKLRRDLLRGSLELATGLLGGATGAGAAYLGALVELDRQAIASIDAIVAGTGRGER